MKWLLVTRSHTETFFLFISRCMPDWLSYTDRMMNPIRDNRLLDCLLNLWQCYQGTVLFVTVYCSSLLADCASPNTFLNRDDSLRVFWGFLSFFSPPCRLPFSQPLITPSLLSSPPPLAVPKRNQTNNLPSHKCAHTNAPNQCGRTNMLV